MKPVVLCIMDGVGYSSDSKGNAFMNANTPSLDLIINKYPSSLLNASGEDVGLPANQMGNSEVGHSNIGAGRVVYQSLEIINKSIKDLSFFNNKQILDSINHSKKYNSKLHIMGLLSDGGVHSHIDHLFSIMDMCKKNDVEEIYLHLFLDGRDTNQSSALTYIERLENKINELKIGVISTISGRFYAMDRDNRYERTKKAYDAIINGYGNEIIYYKEKIKECYSNNVYDEFIEPFIVNKKGIVENKDSIIVFNYRPDRLRELLTAMSNKSFSDFKTKELFDIKLVTMFYVSDTVIAKRAFEHQNLENMFGPYISKKGLKQLRIAETEKYAHVTYFFDGGVELNLKGKDQILIPSPKVTTYDLSPNMSAFEITDRLLAEIDKNIYDVIILNFANGDMLGHTGSYENTIKSIEAMDKCIGRIFDKVRSKKGLLILTADHGNCEEMIDKTGAVITSHSTNKVHFVVTNSKYKLKDGKLADIAPTILKILKLKIPKEMTGKVLIEEKKNKSNLFIVFSLVFLISLIMFFGYRFIKYYNEENQSNDQKINYLYSEIIKEELKVKGYGLYLDNSEYVFKGNVENNYLYYSGTLFRIIKVNKDKTIKLITDDTVASLVYGVETDYNNSYIRSYLNETENKYSGIFYNSLVEPNKYLSKYDYCLDKKCEETINDYIGLLNYSEYEKANSIESYLNINKYFWLINSTEKNNWYVFDKGGVNDSSSNSETYKSYGVRPVINLKSDLIYIAGDGSKENPYIIEENEIVNVTDYVKYSNYLWKIIDIDDNYVKIVMNDYLNINNKELNKVFSNKNNIYNIKDTTSIAYYLNNTFYKTLKNNTLIKEMPWYVGLYNEDTLYDYKKIYEKESLAKVGLLNITDLYTTDLSNYHLITPSFEDMIYSVREDSVLYSSLMEEELKVRPVIYIPNNFKSGIGTKENPYVIEE